MGDRGDGYGRILTMLITVNVGVVAAVAVLHEAGHVLVGHAMDCTVAVHPFATLTRLGCATPPSEPILLASAFLFVAPLSGVFIVRPHYAHRSVGLILIGTGILAAARDIALVLATPGIAPVAALIGGVIALYGDDRLVRGMLAVQRSRLTPLSARRGGGNTTGQEAR